MSTVSIDFDALRNYDKFLFMGLSGFFNIDGGVHDVELSQLRPETQARIAKFLYKRDEPEIFRIDPNEAAKRQKFADEEAAIARLQQYVDEQGLLPILENAGAIRAFLDKNLNSYWSAAGVNAAIANLRSTLQWKPKTTAPVTAPIQPSEPVELLPDGSPRLPLNTVPNRKHTKAQLQDLDKRQRAVRGRNRQGWVGAAFN